MKPLTKTDFILYRNCPHNVWVKIHEPSQYSKFEISDFEKSLAVMGNEVEEIARGMFPDGYLVEKRSDGAQDLTKKLVAQKTAIIFQAVFATEKYLAATDILVWNTSANAYDMYEIKMSSTTAGEESEESEIEDEKPEKSAPKKSSSRELQFEYDLAFQANVFEMCGVKVNNKYLIRLNKKYKKAGDLDFSENQLFVTEDKTETIDTLMPRVLIEMEEAHEFLSPAEMPTHPCPCYYRGRSSHCTAFSYINKDVPEYSVHDINRIGNSKKLLKELLDEGILHIEKVREDQLPKIKEAKEGQKQSKPRKQNQVAVHKSKEPIRDIYAIKAELSSLQFPLYFLDYETYPHAIPFFDGYHPYQHIVFQYSLHVLTEDDFKNGREPKHFECLILDGDPAERLVESLRANIGNTGSIISWYKKFENSRNRELAELVPLHFEFLHNVIARTYDLMDIVDNQYYVHHGFKGSSSIKKVLPVIKDLLALPKNVLDYNMLAVKSGTDAIEAYRKILKGEIVGSAVEKKKQEMLEYCKLDTEAMYIIWKFFTNLVAQSVQDGKTAER